MAARSLPEDVERLLKARIRSLGELEVLLLLHRDPSRFWTAEEVNDELRTSVHSAMRCLSHLHAVQLIEERAGTPPVYRFQPARSEDAASVDTLAAAFKERLSSVIDAIYAPKHDKLREFAEAFRLTKKEEKGDG